MLILPPSVIELIKDTLSSSYNVTGRIPSSKSDLSYLFKNADQSLVQQIERNNFQFTVNHTFKCPWKLQTVQFIFHLVLYLICHFITTWKFKALYKCQNRFTFNFTSRKHPIKIFQWRHNRFKNFCQGLFLMKNENL